MIEVMIVVNGDYGGGRQLGISALIWAMFSIHGRSMSQPTLAFRTANRAKCS